MQGQAIVRLRNASLSALLLTPMAMARPQLTLPPIPAEDDLPAQIRLLKDQLAEQRRALAALQAQVDAQRTAPAVNGVGNRELDNARGAGRPSSGGALADQPQQTGTDGVVPAAADMVRAEPAPPAEAPDAVAARRRAPAGSKAGRAASVAASAAPAAPAAPVVPSTSSGTAASAAAAASATPASGARPARTATRIAQADGGGAVGTPPPRDSRPPAVAPLFEQPGVLTPRGKFVLEPSLQFGYSSSNRVALVGYTVIPALLIGLIDVREVKRNTVTAAMTGRVGLSRRLEAELKVPYVYRSDSTVSRELFTGTAVERVFDTSGRAIGDVEAAVRYQLNDGGADKPYYVGGLRFKSRTGRDPFSVVTDCTRRCIGDNVSGTGLPLDLPTGSGFYSLQPSLTWLLPSDPAVFFGSVSYLHNFKRSGVSRLVLGGERELLGEIKPGDAVGFNFGMGLALNDKASFSLGYDHSTIARTRQNGAAVPGSVRTQLGTLLVGFSYRLNEKRTVNVAIGAGLTRDTPDVSLTIRVPTNF